MLPRQGIATPCHRGARLPDPGHVARDASPSGDCDRPPGSRASRVWWAQSVARDASPSGDCDLRKQLTSPSFLLSRCTRCFPVRGLRLSSFMGYPRCALEILLHEMLPRQGIATPRRAGRPPRCPGGLHEMLPRQGIATEPMLPYLGPIGSIVRCTRCFPVRGLRLDGPLEVPGPEAGVLHEMLPRQGIATSISKLFRSSTSLIVSCTRCFPVRGLRLLLALPHRLGVELGVARDASPSGDCDLGSFGWPEFSFGLHEMLPRQGIATRQGGFYRPPKRPRLHEMLPRQGIATVFSTGNGLPPSASVARDASPSGDCDRRFAARGARRRSGGPVARDASPSGDCDSTSLLIASLLETAMMVARDASPSGDCDQR